MAKKTWVEKRAQANPPLVEVTTKKFADIPENVHMLIPNPGLVDEYIRQIEPGHQTTLAQMRKDLAASHQADYCCPVTAGIFVRIAAEAAWEELQSGKNETEITPFWRIIALKSPTAKKLSFGTQFLQEKRADEGLEE